MLLFAFNLLGCFRFWLGVKNKGKTKRLVEELRCKGSLGLQHSHIETISRQTADFLGKKPRLEKQCDVV